MANFQTAPNQRRIEVMKTPPKDNFMQIKNDDWQEACRTLTPSGFKVYLYFMSNSHGYSFWLSNAIGREAIGISERSFRSGVQELIEKKYLILKEKTTYQAYATPQENEESL